MSSARSLIAVVSVAALLAVGCGDDDAGTDAATSTTSSTAPATSTTASTSTSTVPDAVAEDPPAETGGEDEGLGDPLVFVADLSGDSAAPGPGDPSATGRVEIESDVDGNLCFDMVAIGLDAPVTAAHIHEGAAGQSGGVVIPIGEPTAIDGDSDTWTDVCVPVDADLVDRLNTDPTSFYANIHTETFGAGAIRGQLQQATIFDLTLS